MTKKQTDRYTNLKKVITAAGITLIVLAIIANIFTTSSNITYMSDVLVTLHYYRFTILLGGGFAIGYLISTRSTRVIQSRLFLAVVFSLLAIVIDQLLDVVHVLLLDSMLHIQYPWTRYTFFGAPLIALAIAAVLAVMNQRNNTEPTKLTKNVIIGSFIFYQFYMYITTTCAVFTGDAELAWDLVPWWTTLAGYVASPLVVAIAAFALLGKVNPVMNRLFYSSIIGIIAMYLLYVLWEFRTDLANESTVVFSCIVSLIVILFSAVMIWRARAAR